VSYRILLKRSARRQLDSLSGRSYIKVDRAISSLGQEPRPPRVKKLTDSGLWRVRIGRYRLIYAIDDVEHTVTVVRVARRTEDTYRNLP